MRTLFVTASGTAVGKTFVAAAFARALTAAGKSVAVVKPVISGFAWETAADSDTAVLLKSIGREPTRDAIVAASPWRFEAPLAPDMAARREGRSLDFDALVRFCRDAQRGDGDLLLIEGVGGVMVTLDDRHTVLDWIAALSEPAPDPAPALIVVGSYLGAISHALTAVAAVEARGITIAGVVVDESEASTVPLADTVATLKRFLPGLPLATVRRDADAEAVLTALKPVLGA
ncbi:MAG: dethiobiotin synthase [Rhodospirillales bacterium]|nr:dethiobiotin synthase [Rhodospirillales bacterium]